MLARQRGPELDVVIDKTLAVQAIGPAFGMHNAAPGRHPVARARLDALHASEAVAVHDGAFNKQVTVARPICGCGRLSWLDAGPTRTGPK